jgi:hypothetical protein
MVKLLLQSSPEVPMSNLSALVKQLKQERDRVERQLSGLNAALTAFASVYSGGKPSRKLRKMSAKSRAKIATAQRRRWAKFRKSKA